MQELKKKEMEELDAVFAQFGIDAASAGGAAGEAGAGAGAGEGAEGAGKKKKKKAKAKSEEPQDAQAGGEASGSGGGAPAAAGQQGAGEGGNGAVEEEEEEDDGAPIDPAAVRPRSLGPWGLPWGLTCIRRVGGGLVLSLQAGSLRLRACAHGGQAQAKARLAAASARRDAAKKKAVSSAALAEAKARKAKLSKQKDTKTFNQVCGSRLVLCWPAAPRGVAGGRVVWAQ